MVKASLCGLTIALMKETFSKTTFMAMANTNGKMEEYFRANG